MMIYCFRFPEIKRFFTSLNIITAVPTRMQDKTPSIGLELEPVMEEEASLNSKAVTNVSSCPASLSFFRSLCPGGSWDEVASRNFAWEATPQSQRQILVVDIESPRPHPWHDKCLALDTPIHPIAYGSVAEVLRRSLFEFVVPGLES